MIMDVICFPMVIIGFSEVIGSWKTVAILFPRICPQSFEYFTFARFRIAKDIWDNIDEITKVNFVDEFEKKEEADEEAEEE